jgi:predicted AAA+ superfamily ATPase
MGRYFPYRLHPFSVAELLRSEWTEAVTAPAQKLDEAAWQALLTHGGFPEPFLKQSNSFSTRWRNQRNERLFKEELRDLTRIQEFALLEILGRILESRSGEQLIFSNLAASVQVAPNTIKEWVNTLVSTYYGFLVRPWFKNVTKALRKEPKWYLRDWSGIQDPGAKAETFAACHLLKAVEFWTDLGRGKFDLYYLRDKQKREVDFLVVRDDQPWFLVEIKQHSTSLSPALHHFQKQTGARHAFQVVMELPYLNLNCFDYTQPTVVPARTFFSQLI